MQKTDYAYARNHAILTLFLNCGIRLSELVGISLSDISPDMKKMTVTGKGSKMRTIYLNTACRNALKAYLEVRQSSVHVTKSPTRTRCFSAAAAIAFPTKPCNGW